MMTMQVAAAAVVSGLVLELLAACGVSKPKATASSPTPAPPQPWRWGLWAGQDEYMHFQLEK